MFIRFFRSRAQALLGRFRSAPRCRRRRHAITGYPTLKLFSKGSAGVEYEGERDPASFVTCALNAHSLTAAAVLCVGMPSERRRRVGVCSVSVSRLARLESHSCPLLYHRHINAQTGKKRMVGGLLEPDVGVTVALAEQGRAFAADASKRREILARVEADASADGPLSDGGR